MDGIAGKFIVLIVRTSCILYEKRGCSIIAYSLFSRFYTLNENPLIHDFSTPLFPIYFINKRPLPRRIDAILIIHKINHIVVIETTAKATFFHIIHRLIDNIPNLSSKFIHI